MLERGFVFFSIHHLLPVSRSASSEDFAFPHVLSFSLCNRSPDPDRVRLFTDRWVNAGGNFQFLKHFPLNVAGDLILSLSQNLTEFV